MMFVIISLVYGNCFCDCVQLTPDTILDTEPMKTQRIDREDLGKCSGAGFLKPSFREHRTPTRVSR